MMSTSDNFQLQFEPPWEDIADYPQGIAEGLLEELHKELHSAHSLYGKSISILARRQDNDDILVELEDGRLAVVHLTWVSKPEQGVFPQTRVYKSKRDFSS